MWGSGEVGGGTSEVKDSGAKEEKVSVVAHWGRTDWIRERGRETTSVFSRSATVTDAHHPPLVMLSCTMEYLLVATRWWF